MSPSILVYEDYSYKGRTCLRSTRPNCTRNSIYRSDAKSDSRSSPESDTTSIPDASSNCTNHVFLRCPDLYHRSPDCDERPYKSGT